MNGTYNFVVTQDGRLLLGHGHYYLSQSASSVRAAGQITIGGGKVRAVNNLSGHYKPDAQQTANFKEILGRLGVDVSSAKTKTDTHD